MTNLEKYQEAFITTFGITKEELETLEYQGIPSWDSVGHMQLVAALEDTFGILLDTEDIIEFSSYLIGKQLLSKYEITI